MTKYAFEKGFYLGCPEKNNPPKEEKQDSYIDEIKKAILCFGRETKSCGTKCKNDNK